jgi:hypothetical protein
MDEIYNRLPIMKGEWEINVPGQSETPDDQ